MANKYRFHEHMTTVEVCDYLFGISDRTLRRWKERSGFPRPVDPGGRIYLKDDVDTWLDMQRTTNNGGNNGER